MLSGAVVMLSVAVVMLSVAKHLQHHDAGRKWRFFAALRMTFLRMTLPHSRSRNHRSLMDASASPANIAATNQNRTTVCGSLQPPR